MKRHILDEHVRKQDAEQIRQKHSSIAQVGVDWGAAGWKDVEQIIPHLHRSRATFHTLDEGFFKRRFLHSDYCIVYYEVPAGEFVGWFTKWLRHPKFSTLAKRLGKVVKVQGSHITYWALPNRQLIQVEW